MKDLITCYVIEDEPLAQEIMESYIGRVPFLKLLGSFNGPLEASNQLEKEKPDLLFLDINLPDVDGLSFIPMLRYHPAIILTTAYGEFALKGYELDVDDYLLKPISFERFYKGVWKVYQRLNNIRQPDTNEAFQKANSQEDDYLFVKVGHRIQKIALNEILFIRGMKDYLQIQSARDKSMVLMSFAKITDLLPARKFIRVHKSYIVAVDKIDHIERNRISIGREIIPISDTYSDDFFQKIKWFQPGS